MAEDKHIVSFMETGDRGEGVHGAIETLGINPARGKDVLIKPNFNTADETPGSTHNDTLETLISSLWEMGAKSISLGERSYPPTKDVMEQKGVLPLLSKLDVNVLDFDDLPAKDWVEFRPEGSHWQNGFRVARPILEAECLVYTGCIKTHQFGGVFTMSLKLSVGVVPTNRHGFTYMSELHSSRHQRRLIAEINTPFSPDLIVMDGVDVFVDGGPATGRRAKGNVFLASADRVAVDAVGLAVIKTLGSNDKIMNHPVFSQEQIARAVELGLGASSPEMIDVIAANEKSRTYKDRVVEILLQG